MADETITPEALERLEKAALAIALPDWQRDDLNIYVEYGDRCLSVMDMRDDEAAGADERAEYVVQANPTTILALIAAYRALQSENHDVMMFCNCTLDSNTLVQLATFLKLQAASRTQEGTNGND